MAIKKDYSYQEMQELEKALFIDKKRGSTFLLENIEGLKMLGAKLTVGSDSKLLNCKYKDMFQSSGTPNNLMFLVLPDERVRKVQANLIKTKKDNKKLEEELTKIDSMRKRNNGI